MNYSKGNVRLNSAKTTALWKLLLLTQILKEHCESGFKQIEMFKQYFIKHFLKLWYSSGTHNSIKM